MTITFINGQYSLHGSSRDINELIKELTLTLKMLAEDASLVNNESQDKICLEIMSDLMNSDAQYT